MIPKDDKPMLVVITGDPRRVHHRDRQVGERLAVQRARRHRLHGGVHVWTLALLNRPRNHAEDQIPNARPSRRHDHAARA